MEKINNKRATNINTKAKKAEKGTVTIRKRGNSFEARVRLELKNKLKGADCNPRLSRSAKSAKLIQELIPRWSITSSFASLYSGKYFKTVETYAYTLKKHIKGNFSQYTVPEMTKEIVEEYVSDLRKVYPRAAKDVFLMIRQILQYAKKKELIKEIPEFELKFSKKKRSKKTKLVYLPADRQPIWLDILEKDGRSFCKLFATLLQSGMRPEEGCGLLMSNILFDKDMLYVDNAHKDTTIYDYDFNIIGHEYVDDDLKTEESYREIPLSPRLKKMLQEIYNERKELREKQRRKFDPSKEHVFLNTIGTPYLPERLDKKLKSIIKKYGLEHMTVYGFRHSFATLMSENGMDKEVLREIMGHADFETTEFYYIFISDKRKKEEFKKASHKSFETEKETKLKGIRFTKKKIKAPMKISA